MAIDRKFLDANHADLVAAIFAEGKTAGIEAGRGEGAQAERERIQAVFAQSMPGHGALIQKLAFDGKTTGAEAAVQVLAAERAKLGTKAADLAADAGALAGKTPSPAADPGADAAAAAAQAEADKPIEERCKAKWAKDATLRAEYGEDFKAYLAYERAYAAGRVKVLGQKAA